jgi:hypothetical protein
MRISSTKWAISLFFPPHSYENPLNYFQVGHFTLDNASNNASFMLHLSTLLNDAGVDFDEKKNYIRCFAHIINLCSQAVIKVMEKDDNDESYSDSETEPGTETTDSDEEPVIMRATHYTRKTGPISRARKTVAFIRKSGQRRDELQHIIKEGNTQLRWKEVTVGDNGVVTETQVNPLPSDITVLTQL